MLKRMLEAVTGGSTLRRGTLSYAAAVLGERVISFAALPVITKSFPQASYAVWTQVMVSASLFSTLVCLGFVTAEIRFLAGNHDEGQISSTFHSMLALVALTSVLSVIAIVAFAPAVSRLMFGSPRFSQFARLFAYLLAAESLMEILTAFLRARGRVPRLSVYLLIKSALRVGALAAGVFLFRAGLAPILAAVVGLQLSLVLVLYVKEVARGVGVAMGLRSIAWRQILRFSFAILPYELLVGLQVTINRYLLAHLVGLGSVGVYAASSTLAGIIGLLYSILGFTVFPHMSRHWNQGRTEQAGQTLETALEYYVFGCLPLVAVLTVLHAPLVKLLATSGYVAGWPLIFWLAAGVAVFGIYQLSFYAALLGKTMRSNFGALGAALLTVIAVTLGTASRFGAAGAAASLFAGNVVLAGTSLAISRKVIRYRFPWRTASRAVAGSLAAAAALRAGLLVLNPNFFPALVLLVAVAAAVYAALDLLDKDSVIRRLAWTS